MPEYEIAADAPRTVTEGGTDFDVIVVGAGPAGSAAALTLARAGRSVLLLERGPYPGSKNMYGGVVYGRILDELIPGWYDEAPMQRWITRRQTMIVTDSQALTIDYRTQAWGEKPYNGATTYRADFDGWLAAKAEAAGATLLTSTTATGLLKDANGRVCGVTTDRPDGDLRAKLVIACDGVNSFLAKSAGLYEHFSADHITLGAKEVLAFPRDELEARFGVRGNDGVDIEIVGCTQGLPGGGFVYTNLDTVAVGIVVSVTALAASKLRPEELIAGLKRHPAVAPLVEGGELKEYSAHLIPEGGYDTMPQLVTDGLMVAGDAGAMCLAAGIWLEGVNFAIGAGMYAGQTADAAIRTGDVSATGLAGYRERLESTFVLKDHRKLRRAPDLILSERMQQRYPRIACDLVERMFTVDNPRPKPGVLKLAREGVKKSGVRARELAKDAYTAARSFG
jgi:electron transfer flavoprotein-quinone oxidoreductase